MTKIMKKSTTQNNIKELLAAGFTGVEISKKLKIHQITVMRYRQKLRDEYELKKQ